MSTNFKHSFLDFPSTEATTKAAVKVSPAPVVSKTLDTDWLQKLKHVAYDADDLVDEIVTEAQQSKATKNGNEAAAGMKKRKRQIWDYFPSIEKNRVKDDGIDVRHEAEESLLKFTDVTKFSPKQAPQAIKVRDMRFHCSISALGKKFDDYKMM
ncbi:hypothetical protein ACLOJK_037514 [Asimina triloba]